MNLKSKISSIFLFVCLLSLFSVKNIFAQASSLTIIPPKFELFGNPGDRVSDKIRVRNDSSTPQTYTILIEDFTTSGEEGHVVLEEGENVTSFSLAKWIEVSSKDVILQPNEEKAIDFTISIPKDSEPGGHYASVLFQTSTDAQIEGAGAKVAQRVGSLILLRVSGNVIEKANLEEFSTAKFYQNPPIEFLVRIKNESNTHIIPEGTIVITNLFGKKVAELPLDGRNVLPGAVRKMTTVWNESKLVGMYTATMIATYGQQKLPLTAATKFTVMPTGILITSIIATFTVIGLIVTLIVGRKRLAKILSIIFKG